MRGVADPRSLFRWPAAIFWLPLVIGLAAFLPTLPVAFPTTSSSDMLDAAPSQQVRPHAMPMTAEERGRYRDAAVLRLLVLYGAGVRPFGFFK